MRRFSLTVQLSVAGAVRRARVHPCLISCPSRAFAKRVLSEGFTGAPEARKKRSVGAGARPAGAGAGAAADADSGDSVAALEAESEERLRRMTVEERAPKDVRTAEERVEDLLHHRRSSTLLYRRSLRRNFLLSLKLRRRWEALNALSAEVRAVCLLESRRSLPSHFPVPRDWQGQLVLPEEDGMMGAPPYTEQQIKRYLDWQQQQQSKGLPY